VLTFVVRLAASLVALLAASAAAQDVGGTLRGSVWDPDFDVPVAGVSVLVVETAQSTLTNDQGSYLLEGIRAGRYTVVFSKDGYARQVKADVLVEPGQLTDLDVRMAGEFTEMDEFVVQEVLLFGGASEQSLLALRLASPALMDSIGAELMSRAGASDAASALRLVSGASLAGGKYAVIRGLPDRYVSSQMNGVRLPTADENKRAVELDQFPAAVIESLQVSKTFTPDQQGDASGGAVNVKLRGIPDESFVSISGQVGGNTNTTLSDDFLTYKGGGVNYLGQNNDKDQQLDKLGQNWTGAAGVSEGEAPIDTKWSVSAGGKTEVGDGIRIGALGSLFHEHKTTGYDDGINDSLWVETPGQQLTPQYSQGTPTQGAFKTSLYDVQQSTETVKLGGLGALGIESERNRLTLSYLYTHTADDTATLAQDTRGKAFFFPGYKPNDPNDPGNQKEAVDEAPYLRTETLAYTERTTSTLQLDGEHKLPLGGFSLGVFDFKDPELDWNLSRNAARLDQPDKRQFSSMFIPTYQDPGAPPFLPPFEVPEHWEPYKPSENVNFGNFQRIWKSIDETSLQGSLNLTFPFEQWSGDQGSFKLGAFRDSVERDFNQDTFSNFGDASQFAGGFEDFWSAVFPGELHPISASQFDVDYHGEQDINAWYSMLDLPLNSKFSVVGGARVEQTDIGIVNDAEPFATWIPPGQDAPQALTPGAADVDFHQQDVLPSLGLMYAPVEDVTLRAAWSQTVARQTFKELTPILQQEYVGSSIFIGNPELQMSALTNYDLRADWVPHQGGLLSASWFLKDIKDPIEYVQRPLEPVFTTARNYPEGQLGGWEFEAREQLVNLVDSLEGFGLGANATLIHSEVKLPQDEIDDFAAPGIDVDITERDMTNAPEHLYNLYLTYDTPDAMTQLALFYTVTGDTLVAGAGQANGHFVPDVYAKEYGTLNFSVSHKLSQSTALQFQAKNLTNPKIQEVYRSAVTDDQVKTSYTRGREYTLSFTLRF
jgi:outer membrane receptor protein involved in Fe transport